LINENAIKPRKKLPLVLQYFIAFQCGIYIGSSLIPDAIIGVGYIILSALIVFFAFMGNTKKFFALVPFLIYSEIYARANIHFIIYLYAQYVLLISFLLLLLKQGTVIKFRSRAFVFILMYAFIELVDSFRTVETDFARVAVVNSLLLFVVSFWSSTNQVGLKLLNTFLDNLKLAGVYLVGIVAAAHVSGHIDYVSHSSSAATNGLAPVQISGYLGTASILFFLSIVNELERKNLIANIVIFVMSTTFMLLSFSRGGLYFLVIIVILYFIFNWKKAGNYAMLIILIPIGFLIYNYVITTTNGRIVERYEQQGASGRDELVQVGWTIFLSDPVAGIGTGNFSKEIVKRQLFSVESGAHNEFVRAAAEHGILGIVTYRGFYVALFVEVMLRKGVARSFSLFFFVLFCLIIVHNGMKISVQPMLLLFVVAVPFIPKIADKKNVQNYHKQPA